MAGQLNGPKVVTAQAPFHSVTISKMSFSDLNQTFRSFSEFGPVLEPSPPRNPGFTWMGSGPPRLALPAQGRLTNMVAPLGSKLEEYQKTFLNAHLDIPRPVYGWVEGGRLQELPGWVR